MTTLGELGVLIGAEIEEAGFNKAIAAIGGIEKAADSAASGASAAVGKIGAAADAAAGRYVDAQGRMRESNGRFVSAATLAAEAANNVGGSIGNLSDVAGRASASINSGLVASFASFDRTLRPLEAGIGRLGESAKTLGGNLTTYVTVPLGLLGGAALAAFGKIDSLQRGINAITLQDLAKQGVTGLDAVQEAAAVTGERVKELNEIAKAPGIGFEQAIRGDIRLRAVGISARDSAKDLQQFANAVATSGGSASDFDRVTVQLAQLSAKGKVLAQDLRPIIEAAPAVAQALQKLYGTIDSEDISKQLEKQGKSSSDFINVLTEELAKLPRVTGGFSNQLENFTQGATQNAARLGDSLNKAFNFEGLLSKASDFIDGLTTAFTSLDPATQKLIFGLAAGAAAVGPLIFGFGAIAAAIPSVVAGLEVLGLASTAALGPLGIGVAAVAAAAYLIIDNWDGLVTYFNGEGAQVFRDLADSVTDSVSVISQAFSALSTEGDGSLGGLAVASGVLRAVFLDIVVGLTSFSNTAGGAIGGVVKLLSGDLSGAAAEAQRALYGLIDPVAALFGFTKAGAPETIASFLKVAETEKAIDEAALAGALSVNELTGSLAAANGEADKGAGLLASLREQLKALKEAREAATTTKDTLAFNPQIKAIEEQIKKLEGVDKASKKAADAIAALRLELSRLTALDSFLGDAPSEMQVLERRAETLSAGLKKLVDAGVSTSSKAFQGFARDLVTTSQAFDALAGKAGGLDLKPVAVKSLVPTTIGDTLQADVARLLGDYALKPLELKVPLRLTPLEGTIGDFAKTLQQELLSISQGFAEVNGAAALFGGSFDDAGAKANVLRGALESLLSQGVSPLNPAIQDLAKQYKDYAQESATTTAATQAVKAGISDLASGISSAFSDALSGTQSIGDALLQTLLSTVGNVASELGGILLAAGLGIEALKVSLATFQGIGAIAAGIGLLAIGGIAKGAAGRLAKSGGAGASLGSTASTPSPSRNTAAQEIKIVAEFRLRGPDLVAVGRVAGYRELRTN